MSKIKLDARAKINLSLDVVARRDDGYHDMRMVLQSVTLCDSMTMELTDGGIEVGTNRHFIPNDERNIAVKAARAFMAETGYSGGVRMGIEKRIPVCAGLGGGSADAATVLRGLNELTGAHLSDEKLCELGLSVGSDVPFCVVGGTKLAEGRGEVLTELSPLGSVHTVICMPHFHVSTPSLFAKLRVGRIRLRPDTQGMIQALERGDVRGVAVRVFNVFEAFLPKREADMVQRIKGVLNDSGAMGSSMSGTGAAVYGLFETAEAAQTAAEALSGECREVFVAKTIN